MVPPSPPPGAGSDSTGHSPPRPGPSRSASAAGAMPWWKVAKTMGKSWENHGKIYDQWRSEWENPLEMGTWKWEKTWEHHRNTWGNSIRNGGLELGNDRCLAQIRSISSRISIDFGDMACWIIPWAEWWEDMMENINHITMTETSNIFWYSSPECLLAVSNDDLISLIAVQYHREAAGTSTFWGIEILHQSNS